MCAACSPAETGGAFKSEMSSSRIARQMSESVSKRSIRTFSSEQPRIKSWRLATPWNRIRWSRMAENQARESAWLILIKRPTSSDV